MIRRSSRHGRLVADVGRRAGYTPVFFVDDTPARTGTKVADLPVLDAEAGLARARDEGCAMAFGVGDIMFVRGSTPGLGRRRSPLPGSGRPLRLVAGAVVIDDAAVVAAGAVVNPDARVERGAIVNTGAVIEHDCVVGAFAHVSPGAVLTGGVTIGAAAHVGAGAGCSSAAGSHPARRPQPARRHPGLGRRRHRHGRPACPKEREREPRGSRVGTGPG